MAQRFIDLIVSALASIASIGLSWPFWRDNEYWAESPTMWNLYFIVGFVLATYVFYAFLGSLRTLFQHDEQARAKAKAQEEDKS